MNAITHLHIETPRLPKERLVAGGAAAVAVAGGIVLRIRLRFHNHTPQQLAIGLAFHQQATDELRGDLLRGAGEEGLGEDWELLGGRGGYGSGFGDGWLWEWIEEWVEVIGTPFSPSQQHLLDLMTQQFANRYRHDQGHQ